VTENRSAEIETKPCCLVPCEMF